MLQRHFLAAFLTLSASVVWAQRPSRQVPDNSPAFEEPDAQRTKADVSRLLEHYPPSLQGVLALDPSLLTNQSYLTPYPALASYLNTHPEIARNPSFYIERNFGRRPDDRDNQVFDMWRDALNGVGVFVGFSMAIGLAVWLIRTIVDYRRWNRLTKVQTEVHVKLMDRLTANEDLLAYIQSPAGSKFLESSPIALDPGPRSVGAPLGRILWSVQAGLVLVAGGIGLQLVSGRLSEDASQAIHVFGTLGTAVGVGFVISAIISYVISRQLGLVEPASRTPLPNVPR
jgi:hypothetical protein